MIFVVGMSGHQHTFLGLGLMSSPIVGHLPVESLDSGPQKFTANPRWIPSWVFKSLNPHQRYYIN